MTKGIKPHIVLLKLCSKVSITQRNWVFYSDIQIWYNVDQNDLMAKKWNVVDFEYFLS